jgi:hypothetical protein
MSLCLRSSVASLLLLSSCSCSESDGGAIPGSGVSDGGSTSRGGAGGVADGGGEFSDGSKGKGGGAGKGGKSGTGGSVTSDAGATPDGAVPASGSHASGESCTSGSASDDCRAGLSCTAGTCQLAHQTKEGDSCVASGECSANLACALGRCAPAGTGEAGTGCTTDVDCTSGLRCGIVGFGAECLPEGSSDVGQTCAVSADCLGGLLCAPGPASSACAPIPVTGPGAGVPFGIPTAPTLKCEPSSTGKIEAYFEVPGADGTGAADDFFRLPFPNDARIKAGKIDLSGFPTPGAAFLGFDPVKVYVDAITAGQSGWGTSPSVLFRFSGPVDFDTLRPVSGQPSPVQFLDVTDPQNPGNDGAGWSYSGSSGKYICHDWLAVRRPLGSVLDPGHVYVVYVTTQGHDTNGLPIERSPQLTALLGSTPPVDPGLTNAYAAYAPFRSYLSAQSVSASTILNATVITVAPVRAPMDGLAAAVGAAAVPVATGWVKCGASAVSPCPDAMGDRACGPEATDYDEYHALVALPIFQTGTAPYSIAGGGIDTSAGPVRLENVCAALTVPKGTMPAQGWPLAVFGHGTGGSFRSHVRPEVAGALAKATPPLAVLGYDAVEHGPRRGGSTASPNALFFNFENPAAARGNPLQGAADVLSVGRFAKTLTVPATVTGGAAVTVDPSHLVYFGHSQGSMHGSVALPYTNDYVAAVLAGQGASLTQALLAKTSPTNVAAAVPLLLGGDYEAMGRLFGGETHPVLTLVQAWIDPADPLNFAGGVARRRNTNILPKSVFQPYGLGDTYSPKATMELYAVAAGLPLAAHDPSVTTPDAIAKLPEQPVPLAGNFAAAGRTVTLAVREYANAQGKDGHFVVFDVASANADAVRFLSMAAAGSVPQVGK